MSYSSRGISVQKCLDCCERQRELTELSVRGLLSELLNQVLDIQTRGQDDQVLALVFPVPTRKPFTKVPRFVPRIIRAPRGSPLLIGAVVLLSAFALGSLIAQLAALETLRGVIEGLEPVFTDDCERCIRKAMWTQSNPQEKELLYVRKRIG